MFCNTPNTVKPQWLEHRWLVYHGYFELVLESIGKNPIDADIIIYKIMLRARRNEKEFKVKPATSFKYFQY